MQIFLRIRYLFSHIARTIFIQYNTCSVCRLCSSNTLYICFTTCSFNSVMYLCLICIVCSTIHDAVNPNVTAGDILAPLRAKVSSTNGVTRLNISRNHVWEGARRSFRRPTYCAEYVMSVKFTDDIGVSEGAVDEGGPRREFLQLVIDHLATKSSLFAGPESAKHINPLHTGTAHCPRSNNHT